MVQNVLLIAKSSDRWHSYLTSTLNTVDHSSLIEISLWFPLTSVVSPHSLWKSLFLFKSLFFGELLPNTWSHGGFFEAAGLQVLLLTLSYVSKFTSKPLLSNQVSNFLQIIFSSMSPENYFEKNGIIWSSKQNLPFLLFSLSWWMTLPSTQVFSLLISLYLDKSLMFTTKMYIF